jgi:hypothetical protein
LAHDPHCRRCGVAAALVLAQDSREDCARPRWALLCAECGAVVQAFDRADTRLLMQRLNLRMKEIDRRIARNAAQIGA